MRSLEPRELTEGMVLAEPVITQAGQVLAPKGSTVSRQLINRIRLYRIGHVAVEEAPDTAAPRQEQAKTHAEKSRTHSQKVAASDQFRDFQFVYYETIEEMKRSFTGLVERGEPIDTDRLLAASSDLFRLRSTIAEMFDMLFNLRTVADAVYAHCLNVALISRMIGRWLKDDQETRDLLTLAGMLHDIGKIKIPDEVLNKPAALTEAEFALIKQHPRFGYELLKGQPLNDHIKKAALMHHERSDGSGYPTGLTDDKIDSIAQIVGIADVYDAMTTSRSYRTPLCPFEVISRFEQEGFQKYNTRYILTFLQQIAATYQNNRVILSNGKCGQIVMLNPNALSRPMVQFDDNTVLDLSTADKDLYIRAIF